MCEHGFDQFVTFVRVKDLGVSRCFYEDVLKLPLILDQGTCLIFGITATAFVGLCAQESAPNPKGVILTLVTDQLKAWHERLSKAGFPPDGEVRYNAQFNITHFYVKDPNGYDVELQTFHDPSWPQVGPS